MGKLSTFLHQCFGCSHAWVDTAKLITREVKGHKHTYQYYRDAKVCDFCGKQEISPEFRQRIEKEPRK